MSVKIELSRGGGGVGNCSWTGSCLVGESEIQKMPLLTEYHFNNK